jgi:putative flippase GtrA
MIKRRLYQVSEAIVVGRVGEPVRFVAVGGVGFIIDAGILSALMRFAGMGPYSARAISYLVAATCTWALHRTFTFNRPHGGSWIYQWGRFLVANAFGGILNYGIFCALVAEILFFTRNPVLALALSSAIAVVVNYVVSARAVFTPSKTSSPVRTLERVDLD